MIILPLRAQLVWLLITVSCYSLASEPAISPTTNTAIHAPRIIALAPHIVELLFAIGAGKQIIATSEFANYPVAAQKIPRVGNYLSLQLEKIVALKPDYIIAWKNGSPAADLAKLQQLGLHIIYSEPKTFDDIASELLRFGKLTGHQQRSMALAQQFRQQLHAIIQRYQHKTKLLGFYELWSKPLMTIAQHSWPEQHLDICGVTNPFINLPSAYPQVNTEQVVSLPLQIIIAPISKKQPNNPTFSWQKWPMIPAVKYQQIITPDADQLHRMTLRALAELARLCEQVDHVRQFYQQQHNQSISTTTAR